MREFEFFKRRVRFFIGTDLWLTPVFCFTNSKECISVSLAVICFELEFVIKYKD